MFVHFQSWKERIQMYNIHLKKYVFCHSAKPSLFWFCSSEVICMCTVYTYSTNSTFNDGRTEIKPQVSSSFWNFYRNSEHCLIISMSESLWETYQS